MNRIPELIGLRIVYIIFAGLMLYLIRAAAPKPGGGNYPVKRFRHLLIMRYGSFLLIAGYVLLVLYYPLWILIQTRDSLVGALLLDDLFSLVLLLTFLLFFLWQLYQMDRETKTIRSSFGSYLMQYGYFWLFVLNILIFLRMDYFYLPLLPGNLPLAGWIGVEAGVAAVFILLQLLVLFVRRLKMAPAGPELKALVEEVAGHFKIKVRGIRIWRLERVANAFATGLFFRSIFLTEELINSTTPEDLRMIVGHECAHFKRRHLETRMVVIGGLLFLGSYLLEEYPDLHWLFFVIFGLTAIIIFKLISRRQEFEADRLAAKLLGGGEKMAEALTRVFEQNSAPGNFGLIIRILVGHPDLAARVKALTRKRF